MYAAEKLFYPSLNSPSQYSAFSMFSLVDSHAEIESQQFEFYTGAKMEVL